MPNAVRSSAAPVADAAIRDRPVREIFNESASTYRFLNSALTGGLDAYWRSRAARVAASAGGDAWLDVCTGTGDMAQLLRRYAAGTTRVFATDFCLPMVREAGSPGTAGVMFALAESNRLPFVDKSFDVVTLSFAARNLYFSPGSIVPYYREFLRVLRPGGMFVNVETTRPAWPPMRAILSLHARMVVGPVGSLVSGSHGSYRYLSSTIRRFCGAAELAEVVRSAGFGRVEHQTLFPGIVAIHRAWR